MLPDKDENQRNEFIELLKKISQLELEIHSRGELTFSEVTSLLKDFYFFGTTMYGQGLCNHIADSTYTRLAALLSLWASCEDIQLSLEDMCEFLLYKEIISSIFYSSGFRGFTHLKTYLAERTPEGNFTIPQNKLVIYFLFVHIDDVDPYYLSLAKKMPDTVFTVLMLGWLNCSVVLTPQGENNRKYLHQHSNLLVKINPNQAFMSSVMNAWMYCSYSPSSNKRDVKKNINKMIGNFLRSSGLMISKTRIVEKRAKPRLLVLHERAGRNHAMFRCYLPFFASMAEFFDLYSLAEQDLTDELSQQVFPRHQQIADVRDLQAIVDVVTDIAPDIIYYPSLGMSHWTIYLANLRLAPMQMMSCGHPDSSFIDTIDFLYFGPVMLGAEHCASENIMQSNSFKFISMAHSDLPADLLNIQKHNDSVTHIAINCNAMKLSSEFVQSLQQLKVEFGSAIRFHFFPAGAGMVNDGFRSMLKKQFPDAETYPPMPYSDFMMAIGKCHLSLSPFPFGNTNSTVDALLLGLPVLALKGYEFCSYTDYLVMESFGLAEYFMSDSVEAFLDHVRKILSDNHYYLECVQKVKEMKIADRIRYDNKPDNDFGEFVFNVYKKLNMYKSTKHKVVTWNGHIV
jgi:hypothetical protein